MGMAERITHAQLSGNLSEAKTADELADVDVIRALGMIAATNPLGSAIWRLKYAQVESLLPYIVGQLTKIAIEKQQAESAEEVLSSLNRVVPHWLDDLCHQCSGRGYEVVPGTPMLSDKSCKVCRGSGRVQVDASRDLDLYLLDLLQRFEQDCSKYVYRRLADS